MDRIVEICLCAVAWAVTMTRFARLSKNNAWRTDRASSQIWYSTLFFALTLTFLVQPIADPFDRLTNNNLSRLIAYGSLAVTLYINAVVLLQTYQTLRHRQILRLIRPYLLFTLSALAAAYILFVGRSPQWEDHHTAQSIGEVYFMFALFSYAFVLGLAISSACYQYRRVERVSVTRFRVLTIFLTAAAATIYFFIKILLVMGYFWSPLGSAPMISLSKASLIITALLWGVAFMNNKIYLRVVRPLKGIVHWPAYRDLLVLTDALDRLCPSVALIRRRPTRWQYALKPEHYLVEAVIRAMDGRALLADYLSDRGTRHRPKWWNAGLMQQASDVLRLLQDVRVEDDIWEVARAYGNVGRLLRQRQRSLSMAEVPA